MGILKARVDGTWVEIAGVGMPAGGTPGQVLTKTSAADYATAWQAPTTPILANNTYLQGYRADGTTAQQLIGIDASNHIRIATSAPGVLFIGGSTGTAIHLGETSQGPVYVGYGSAGTVEIGTNALNDIRIGNGLAAGKNVYVPRLTVQGTLTLMDDRWVMASSGSLLMNYNGGNLYFSNAVNLVVNDAGGRAYFKRDLECATTIYKSGVGPYTFPDFVFEQHFTGGIERFRDAPGADTYEGLWPLARVEEFAQEHWRLPGHAAREHDRVDIFRRTHDLLAELERVYLHLFEHERRLTELEER